MDRKNGSDANDPKRQQGASPLPGGSIAFPILTLATTSWAWEVRLGALALRIIAMPSRWPHTPWQRVRPFDWAISSEIGKSHLGQETTPPPNIPFRRTMFRRAKYSCSRGLRKWLTGTVRVAPNYLIFTDLTRPIAALEEKTNIEISINRQRSIPISTPNKRQIALAAHERKEATKPITPLRTVILPRPVARTGLPTRAGLQATSAEVSVGASTLWLTEWATVGEELPRDSDWRWYAALTSRCLSDVALPRVELGSLEDLYRLGRELGGGVKGGCMAVRCRRSLTRLAQSRFGWAEVPKVGPAPAMSTAPIIELSSGLARALWKDDCPMGAVIVKDDSYWVGLSEQHHQILTGSCVMIPVKVFRRVATNASNLSIAMWLVTIAQSAQDPYCLDQRVVEAFVSRISATPPAKTLWALYSAVKTLTEALAAEGHHRAIKIDLERIDTSQAKKSRGRPRIEWTMKINPAGRPFKTRKV